ncbi:MAG: GTPase [Planctomycetia bacterium]|nr:GTPase [Planctomycetia bacterium]MBL6915359.1 GTPase [Planctomycetota bacterium]HCW44912.1 GTPase [Planctomycetota bacterium]
MVQINFSLKEVNCKIVYYGPGLSGKTTNLEVVHKKAPQPSVGDLTSIATEGDRTLFFDFLPLNLGQVAGMKTKFQIYTVPGQVYYNSTRKLVLQGADGVVFVADSKRGKMEENIESLKNLEENLKEHGLSFNSIPVVLQYNKRDLPDVYSVEELDEALNSFAAPHVEAVARDGEGVFPTLKKLAGMVLQSLNDQHSSVKSGSVSSPHSRTTHTPAAAETTTNSTTAVATATTPPRTRTRATGTRQAAPPKGRRTTASVAYGASARPRIVSSPRRQKRRQGIVIGMTVGISAVAAAIGLYLSNMLGFFS